MKKSLTTGSVLKSVIRFSLPYLLSCLLQTLYGMVATHKTVSINKLK